jgi:hypothetical protein
MIRGYSCARASCARMSPTEYGISSPRWQFITEPSFSSARKYPLAQLDESDFPSHWCVVYLTENATLSIHLDIWFNHLSKSHPEYGPLRQSPTEHHIVPDITHSPIRYNTTLYATSKEAIAKWDIEEPISSQLPVVVTLQKK